MSVLNPKAPASEAIALRVRKIGDRFEVTKDDVLLGTSGNEMLAIWSAVFAAEEIAKSGCDVRVVAVRDGRDIEEFCARA